MSLGKSRPKPDKPSSSGSPKDVLYDQLLRSLQGPDSLPTDKEFFQFVREWNKTHRGASLILDPAWPYPMQRYQALELLQALDSRSYYVARQGLWESDSIDREAQGLEPLLPPDEQAVKDEWLQWRLGLIQQYQLQGLIPDEPTDVES